MKPVISQSVYNKLCGLLKRIKSPEAKMLGAELSKAEIVKDEDIKNDIVNLNSTVQFIYEALNKPMQIQIVMPEEADLVNHRVSILAPISIALIGFRESYSFKWILPGGTKHLKIIKVENA